MEWRLYPLDVWFFRGTAPMNAGESIVGESYFPPSPEVVQGFVRTALLVALGIPLDAYDRAVRENSSVVPEDVRQAFNLVGRGSYDMGQVDIRGPYIVRQLANGDVERWFPAPLDIYPTEDGRWRPVAPDPDPVECDMGRVRLLPSPPRDDGPTDGWISEKGLNDYLTGKSILSEHIKGGTDFYAIEPRIGIARNATTRTVQERMLYSVQFIRLGRRLQDNVGERIGIGVEVNGVDEELQRACAGVHRFGGEGRLAELEVHSGPGLSLPSPVPASTCRLLLLTPARWDGSWLPRGFQQADDGWRVAFGGVQTTVVSAAVGKPVRIGGWDMVLGRSKPAVACVPAGSVYYLRADKPAQVAALHGQKLDSISGSGFGHVVIGNWNEGGKQ